MKHKDLTPNKAGVESGLAEAEKFNGTTPVTKVKKVEGFDGEMHDVESNNQEQGGVF